MTIPTPPSDPPPADMARAREMFGDALAQIQSFAAETLALSPQELGARAAWTLGVIVVAALLLWCLRFVCKSIAKRVAPQDDTGRKHGFKLGGWTMAIARLAVWVAAALAILAVWGVGVSQILNGPMGGALAAIGRAAITVVVMLAAIDLAQAAISRVFGNFAARARTPRRAAQLRTVAPVVGGVVAGVLFVIAAMMVLGQIGVEIGPLLAGAGIVGLAIGFGAQTIVKDFLTGLFLLLEDTVSIGDVVKIGDASGLVEAMSVRTIKLRAFDGTLQIIPYAEAQIIHNMTKDFSFYVFDLRISYASDLMKALELMKQVGDELMQDEKFKPVILAPIEISGVDRLSDSGVVLKARIKTLPIQQWSVGREYLKRIKLAFDAAGIEIAVPHLKLVPPDEPIPVDDAHMRQTQLS